MQNEVNTKRNKTIACHKDYNFKNSERSIIDTEMMR